MGSYLVKSSLGERVFAKEDDATDYQIRILSQVGVKSEVLRIYEDIKETPERMSAEEFAYVQLKEES